MPLDVDSVSIRLSRRPIIWVKETDSTMHDAARLAFMGCASGTVVGASAQTAGQGRLGRKWHSVPDAGLYFSVVLRLSLPPDHLPVVTLAAGLAAAEGITAAGGLAVDLRWPNDVLIGEKKVCGILIEQHQSALVCGIGINVSHTGFPPELEPIATSLYLAGARSVKSEDLLVAVLESLDRHVLLLAEKGLEPVLALFAQASSYVSGRRVVVDQEDTQIRGVTDGLDPNGFLWVRQDDGVRKLILAGGVRPG
jgi:BirA family biotin operon repressor/biotin-[acetyl-CoA-carboxylase] ligase